MPKSTAKKLEYMKGYAAAHREERRSYMAGYLAANADKIAVAMRKSRLWSVHRITPEDYFICLDEQDGHCALCDRRPDEEHFGFLHVDHDHTKQPGEPGYFRGLLCFRRNTGLQRFGDSEAGVLRALEYVSKKRWVACHL